MGACFAGFRLEQLAGKAVILFAGYNFRKGNGGLKGVTAVFALPQMAHAAIINVF
jgi:hypothetical protein